VLASLLAFLAFLLPFLAFTGLRARAQAPDRGDYSVAGDYFVPADTDVGAEELLLGGPDPFVQIVVPTSVPWATAVDIGTPLAAYAFPDGGTFTWSAIGPGEVTFGGQEAGAKVPALEAALLYGAATSSTTMTVTEPGDYTVTVEYEKDGEVASATKTPIAALEADLRMDGLSEGQEEDPGAFLCVGGPRRGVTLVCSYFEPFVAHWAALGIPDGLKPYDAQAGGSEVTVLEWDDDPEGRDNWGAMPGQVWLEAVSPGTGHVSLNYTGRVPANGAVHSDLARVNYVWVDLDIEDVPEPQEEDPGGFIALGGPRKKILLSATPDDSGPIKLEVVHGADKVDIYADPTGGDPLTGEDLTWTTVQEMPGQLWVQAEKASGGLGDVELKLSFDADHAYESVKLTVCEVGLKSVTFSGADFHPVCVDTTGQAYGIPHWVDNSDPLNGNATDEGDEENPVCYVRADTPIATVRFLASPPGAFTGARIGGDGPGALDFPETRAAFVQDEGKWYAEAQIPSSDNLPDEVHRYAPLTVEWTLTSDEPGGASAGQSHNEAFVTLATPQCAKLYRTVAYLATALGGATDEATALDNTWAMFSTGTGPKDVCAWNDATRAYDRKLYYWLFVAEPESLMANFTPELLQRANGTCQAWVDLFHQVLLVNQAGPQEVVKPVRVLPFGHTQGHDADFRLVVRNVEWSDDPDYPADPPWIYSYEDIVRTSAGLPGQNVETPARKVFLYHFVAQRYLLQGGGTYYDPSYGITATSAGDFTGKAIAGWGQRRADGNIHYKTVGQEAVVFQPLEW
jgi:hypothetical protein